MRNGKQETVHGVRPSVTLTSGWRMGISLFCLGLAVAATSPAQDEQPLPDAMNFKVLVNFDGTNGSGPSGSLVQGIDGNLYGVTGGGGTNGNGTLFKITPQGSLSVLYNFCSQPNCADGQGPNGLALGRDGNIYGTANLGGTNGGGTFFKLTSTGVATLYNFCSPYSCEPGCPNPVVAGADGNFYGTTGGCLNGSVFKITPQGVLTVLWDFCSLPNCADGYATLASLMQGDDGDFYGAAQAGGAYGYGTIFKITPKGALTTLYNFCSQPNCADGWGPLSPPVQATNGNFYGTVQSPLIHPSPGSVFEFTRDAVFNTLYNFCTLPNCADGDAPYNSPLIQGTNGYLYGITFAGGNNALNCDYPGEAGCGTIFEITPGGTPTTLHDFNSADVSSPFYSYNGGLVQATNGTFYGPTASGGANGNGTVFSLSVGLGPFVETVSKIGKVGEDILILGTDLTGATAVNFNGTPALFTVDSKTLISATVPAGSTTGFVTVTTSTGTLKSNAKFQVR